MSSSSESSSESFKSLRYGSSAFLPASASTLKYIWSYYGQYYSCLYKIYEDLQIVLRFCWNFELVKFWQNFGKIFGEDFVSPSPKKETWEMPYTALCKFYIFAEISIIPLEILSSADLNYFNGGMFNCVQVIWLGLCDTNESHVMFSQNFVPGNPRF